MAGRGRPAQTRQLTTDEAKEQFLKLRLTGMTVEKAMAEVGRNSGAKAYEYWRRTDQTFKDRADQASAVISDRKAEIDPKTLDFATFSERYLGQRIFWHQQQWVDLLEGREPRDLHPGEVYIKGDPTRVVVNTPPFHAKSTTLTINYVTYRVCMDPNIRILIVSQTLDMARKFLAGIKYRLDHPRYRALQQDFAPHGGWKSTADAWRADWIYVGGDGRDSGEKDPTIQALGMGGQIYGARADLVILDDTITGKNAAEAEKQLTWLNTEVDSRIEEDTGKMLIVGTRIAPNDLYGVLTDPDTFLSEDEESDEAPWTYLAQPAVLAYGEKPAEWQTLWPRSDVPWSKETAPDADGLFPRWDGTRLAKKRRKLGPRMWSLVYMQTGAPEDSVFDTRAIQQCINGQRKVGPMRVDAVGHRRRGMDGLYTIGSIDPSGSGQSAFVVYAVDRETQQRFVLQAKTLSPWQWPVVRALIKEWTETFNIAEWVVEKNMYHAALRHDEDTVHYLQSRGVRMSEHYTGSNKLDPNVGVMSLAPLFGEWEFQGSQWVATAEPLIELASTYLSDGMSQLVEQLTIWQPDPPKGTKTDLVMALWFAELRAREVAGLGRRPTHRTPSRFMSARRRESQVVVNMRDFLTQTG